MYKIVRDDNHRRLNLNIFNKLFYLKSVKQTFLNVPKIFNITLQFLFKYNNSKEKYYIF